MPPSPFLAPPPPPSAHPATLAVAPPSPSAAPPSAETSPPWSSILQLLHIGAPSPCSPTHPHHNLLPAIRAPSATAASPPKQQQGQLDLYPASHPDRLQYAASRLSLFGQLLQMSGTQLLTAQRSHLQALRLRLQCLGETHPLAIASMVAVADCCSRLGRTQESQMFLEQAWHAVASARGPSHPESLNAQVEVARGHLQMGDSATAATLLRSASSLLDSALGRRHPDSLACLCLLADALKASRDSEGQLRVLREALQRRRAGGEGAAGAEAGSVAPVEVASALHAIGACLQSLGRGEEAEASWREALELVGHGLEDTQLCTMQVLQSLAGCLYGQGRLADALPYYERLAAARSAAYGPTHPDAQSALHLLKGVRAQVNVLWSEAIKS